MGEIIDIVAKWGERAQRCRQINSRTGSVVDVLLGAGGIFVLIAMGTVAGYFMEKYKKL